MIEKELSFSFPSGHILAAVVFFGFFIYLSIRYLKSKNLKFILTTLFIFTTLMIGISRLILNVHWLSDLIGGLFLGLFLVLGAIFIKEKYVSD